MESSLSHFPPLRFSPVFNTNEIGYTQGNHEYCDDQYGDGSTDSSPLIRSLAAMAAILKPGAVSFITSSTIFGGEVVYARRRGCKAMESKHDEPQERA